MCVSGIARRQSPSWTSFATGCSWPERPANGDVSEPDATQMAGSRPTSSTTRQARTESRTGWQFPFIAILRMYWPKSDALTVNGRICRCKRVRKGRTLASTGDTNDARRLAAQLLVSAESGRVRPRDAFEHSAVRGVRAARCVASVGRTPPRPAYANDINEPNNRDFEFGQG
jgi:hypothetical protein